jgi:uncharacterized repeat protein (TIGR03803 family)
MLHSFAGGSDGAYPDTPPALDQHGNVFGTTGYGGSGCSSQGCGTAFELSQRNGHWGYRQTLEFSSPNDSPSVPAGRLVIDATGNIYGTDYSAGDISCNCGAVFQLSESGGVWTKTSLHDFLGGSDGQYPSSGLIADAAGNLYGTTQAGGVNNSQGTVFELVRNSDGTWTYSVIHSFGGSLESGAPDGAVPSGPLACDAFGNLYGTTSSGGRYGDGVVYRLSPSGGTWNDTIVYYFTLEYGFYQGASGIAVDANGNLYGATNAGGLYSLGTIYKLTPGVGYWKRTVLYTFTGGNDGAYPQAFGGLVLDQNGAIYGITVYGGQFGYGTVFKLVNGKRGNWNEVTLHGFRSTDGTQPIGIALDSSGHIFGSTNSGGANNFGVMYEIIQ